MTEPLTPRDLEFMRLQAAHAALLQVVLQLAYTVATLSPDTRARLLQQCEMLPRATEGRSLPAPRQSGRQLLKGVVARILCVSLDHAVQRSVWNPDALGFWPHLVEC